MALVWGLLRLTLDGAVLFRQVRSGHGGRVFSLVKFRTMNDARDANGRLLPDAQRVTSLGKFLRASRLDELPEFWNVLRGDMGIIGPRPLLPETIASFGEAGKHRGVLRPGLTGWSQVNGGAELSNTEKLSLDLWYIDHRSIPLDLLILLKTPMVFIRGETFDRANIKSACDYARRSYRLG
jgi:lipopolysaccharide/colanic/teichoic acid biosynthesis glycosyltransferase